MAGRGGGGACHGDHTAALSLFPSAQVMALDREVAMIEGNEGSRGPVTRFFPVHPTGVVVLIDRYEIVVRRLLWRATQGWRPGVPAKSTHHL